ncbi:MAG: glycosyltransferase family 2 protein [Acidimicrobiaceae bacterium]|nr:glycosyltransferase family 2 protein [Acidimicrobiaceae bacterium]
MAGTERSPDRGVRASVVVLNLNGRRYLDACIEALLSQHLEGGHEVLLVDNGSTDGSADYVRGHWPDVCVIDAGRNLGFAAGNNLGIERARGRHVVLLNNDTRVRPGWLSALVSTAEGDDSIGAVTSKVVFLERPGTIQNAGSLLLSDGSGADRGSGEQDLGQYDSRTEVFGLCGCATLLNRVALDDVGVLDSTFFCYYEDTDLSWRLRLRAWRIVYEPTAVVEHLHSGTSVEWSPFFTFHVDRNRLFMIIKNAPPWFVARCFAGFGLMSFKMVLRAAIRPFRAQRETLPGPRAGISPIVRARLHASVMRSFLEHLPEMLRKRRQIRGARSVSDREIFRWLHSRKQWDSHSE